MNSGICENGRITDNHSNKCLHGVVGHYWTKVKLDALGKHVHAYTCICKMENKQGLKFVTISH